MKAEYPLEMCPKCGSKKLEITWVEQSIGEPVVNRVIDCDKCGYYWQESFDFFLADETVSGDELELDEKGFLIKEKEKE